MKRFVILCAIFLFTCPIISAQEYKYEARLGWIWMDYLTLTKMTAKADPAEGITLGPMKTIGVFSADFDFKIKNWLVVGANVDYRNFWRKVTPYDFTYQDGPWTSRDQYIVLMPTVKFTTGFESFFRYYATVGLGAGLHLTSGADSSTCKFLPAVQLTPIGIAVGRRVSWFFEIGIGSAFTGCMTGITCRF